jgi:hypothetical protein
MVFQNYIVLNLLEDYSYSVLIVPDKIIFKDFAKEFIKTYEIVLPYTTSIKNINRKKIYEEYLEGDN